MSELRPAALCLCFALGATACVPSLAAQYRRIADQALHAVPDPKDLGPDIYPVHTLAQIARFDEVFGAMEAFAEMPHAELESYRTRLHDAQRAFALRAAAQAQTPGAGFIIASELLLPESQYTEANRELLRVARDLAAARVAAMHTYFAADHTYDFEAKDEKPGCVLATRAFAGDAVENAGIAAHFEGARPTIHVRCHPGTRPLEWGVDLINVHHQERTSFVISLSYSAKGGQRFAHSIPITGSRRYEDPVETEFTPKEDVMVDGIDFAVVTVALDYLVLSGWRTLGPDDRVDTHVRPDLHTVTTTRFLWERTPQE